MMCRLFLTPKCGQLLTKPLFWYFMAYRHGFRAISSMHPAFIVHRSLSREVQLRVVFQLSQLQSTRTLALSSSAKDQIRTILLIDETGNNLGEKTAREALQIAQEKGLNLVSVNKEDRTANPVYKLMRKNDRKQKGNHEALKLKEVVVSVNIAPHDLNFRINQIQKFLEKGHRVQFSVTSRRGDQKKNEDVIKTVKKALLEVGEIDGRLKEGNSRVSGIFRYIGNAKIDEP